MAPASARQPLAGWLGLAIVWAVVLTLALMLRGSEGAQPIFLVFVGCCLVREHPSRRPKRKLVIESGGVGYEIVREIRVCPTCANSPRFVMPCQHCRISQ